MKDLQSQKCWMNIHIDDRCWSCQDGGSNKSGQEEDSGKCLMNEGKDIRWGSTWYYLIARTTNELWILKEKGAEMVWKWRWGAATYSTWTPWGMWGKLTFAQEDCRGSDFFKAQPYSSYKTEIKGTLREELEATGEFLNDRLWVPEGRKEGLMKLGRELGPILSSAEQYVNKGLVNDG